MRSLNIARCRDCGTRSPLPVLILAALLVVLAVGGLADRDRHQSAAPPGPVGMASATPLSPPLPTSPAARAYTATDLTELDREATREATRRALIASRWRLTEPFYSGSAVLRSEAVQELREVRPQFDSRNARVMVTVWTWDEDRAAGAWALSNERVSAVRGALLAELQAPPDRVDVEGYVVADVADLTDLTDPAAVRVAPTDGTSGSGAWRYNNVNELELRLVGV